MKKILISTVAAARAYFLANRVTLIVWALIVVVIAAAVTANHATKADIRAKLVSKDPAVQSAEVLELANSRNLADALSDTEDPNTPPTSPQNVESTKIREAAAATLDTLIQQGKVAPDVALDNLFSLRKDTDGGVKTSATNGLALVGSANDDNLKKIVARLSDGDPDIRAAAADALGKIGGSKTAGLVAPLMTDPAASDAATKALTEIGAPSVPYLTAMLPASKPGLRATLVNTLAAIGDPSAIPALIAQVDLQPPLLNIRRLSTIGLTTVVLQNLPASLAPGQVVLKPAPPLSAANRALIQTTLPIFTETLVNTQRDSFARSRSALALGRLGGNAAIAALAKSLGDYDARVAGSAQTAIQQIGATAVPSLAAAVQNPNEAVRIAAASALGGIGTASALAAIKHALVDPSENVRMAAATALGISQSIGAVPLLIPLLSDTSGGVAEAAGNSLHMIGPPAVPSLIATLGSSNQAAAFYASKALLSMGNLAIPQIAAALQGADPSQQKVWAAVTLGLMHDSAGRPALTAAAASGSPRLRWAASQALQQIG